MWNHRECSAATSATPARSSTMPALVVPAVATTPMTSSRRWDPRAARPAAPSRSGGGRAVATVSVPTPSTWSALPTEECASSLRATSGRTGRVGLAPVPRRVAGHHERRQVAGRTARHEAAAGALGQAGLRRQHAEGLVLGHDDAGRLEPGGAVQRRAGDEHVEEQRGLRRRGRDERQEARAVARDHRRGQLVDEQLAAPGRRRCPRAASARPVRRRATRRGRRSRGRPGPWTGAPGRPPRSGRSWPRRSGTSRSPSGRRASGAPGRPLPAARQASSARLATSWGERRVLAATSATSSNSGLARPLLTFMRMVMPSTVTCSSVRATGQRSTAVARIPMVPVDPLRSRRAAPRRAWRRSGRGGRGRAGPSSW